MSHLLMAWLYWAQVAGIVSHGSAAMLGILAFGYWASAPGATAVVSGWERDEIGTLREMISAPSERQQRQRKHHLAVAKTLFKRSLLIWIAGTVLVMGSASVEAVYRDALCPIGRVCSSMLPLGAP